MLLRRYVSRTFTGAACALALLSTSAGADVGARVYVQEWNPQQPADRIGTYVVQDNKLVSEAVNIGWTAARASICDKINDSLRKANAAGSGISFNQINCDMGRAGDLMLVDKPPYTSKNFVLRFVVKDNFLDLHSTTPNLKDGKIEVWAGAGAVLGGAALGLPGIAVLGAASFLEGLFGGHGVGDWANPEFKILYNLKLDFGLSTSGQLVVTKADTEVTDVRPSAANAPASLLKLAADFANAVFRTPAFSALVAKGAQDGGNKDFAPQVNAALNGLNNRIRDAVASTAAPSRVNVAKLVSAGVWGKNNQITFVFSPEAPLPQALTGAIQGTIRMTRSAYLKTDICPPAPGLVSSVAVGPPPILDVDPFVYGSVPTKEFPGAIRYTANPNVQNVTATSFDCPYLLGSLPFGTPNDIHYDGNGTGGLPGVSGPRSDANVATVFVIDPLGWQPTLLLNGVVTGKDWIATVKTSLNANALRTQTTKPYIDKGDPARDRFNTGVQQTTPAAGSTATQTTTPSAPSASKLSPGAAQSLNPQPLPPKAIQR